MSINVENTDEQELLALLQGEHLIAPAFDGDELPAWAIYKLKRGEDGSQRGEFVAFVPRAV